MTSGTLTLLGLLPLARTAPAPSDYRLITQGTGGTFSYNGYSDPNAIGTDGCGTCVGFYVNLPGLNPGKRP